MFSDALDAPKDCNVGIVNGTLLPNGRRLFIADLDTKESAQAEAATFNKRYKELEAKVGSFPRQSWPGQRHSGAVAGICIFRLGPKSTSGPSLVFCQDRQPDSGRRARFDDGRQALYVGTGPRSLGH